MGNGGCTGTLRFKEHTELLLWEQNALSEHATAFPDSIRSRDYYSNIEARYIASTQKFRTWNL